MQDKTLIEPFDWQVVVAKLKQEPISEKCLKVKLEKIFHLNSTCEQEYLPDIRELYHWMFVFNRHVDFRTFISGDKLQRFFIEEFLPLSIKYLILSKKFKLAELMALTEQIILESLDLLVKMFAELDRYPKFVLVALLALQHARYFYKLSFQANYTHLLKQPTEEERNANYEFVEGLKEGTEVDALKIDTFTGYMIWSRAIVSRVNTNVLAVSYLHERRTSDRSMSKANMEIAPSKYFTETNFDWRLSLKVGDKVDYAMMTGIWKQFQVLEIRRLEEDGQIICMLGLNTIDLDNLEWVASTSVNVQPPRTFSTEATDMEDLAISKKNLQQSKIKDHNDILLARGKFDEAAVCRSEISKSLDIIYFINHLQRKGFFDLIIKRLEATTPSAPIEVTIELVNVVAGICRLFHREYALSYIPRLTDALVRYLLKSSDSNIRNFSKERLDALFISFDEFFSRFLTLSEKKRKKYELQPRLAKMFIESQFLDRKLNSLSIMTDLIRQARLEEDSANELKMIQDWIIDNRIVEKLYQQGSHPQLITRSSDLLKLYLGTNPPVKSLEPLLELNQPILKLIVENLSYFPMEFLKEVGDKIVAKELPLDPTTTLSIVKTVGGYERYLLSKGGMGWVDVVKDKKNRREDVVELMNHSFPVVSKIFLEMIRIEYKFIQTFLKQACDIDYAQRVLDDPTIDTFKKVEFLRPYFKYITQVDEHGIDQIDTLWQQVLAVSDPTKQLFETFMQVLEQVQPNQTHNFFNKHFTKKEDLRRVTISSFNIFNKLVSSLNNDIEDGEPNKMGMSELITMIFQNQNLAVTKNALELMSQLMDKYEKEDIGVFKEGFLDKCLTRLYEGGNYEKYLSILMSILNESEKAGNGNLAPVSRQLPPEKLQLTVLNHFNQLRTRLHITVDSNLTLYELRHEIGKMVNALGHQLKLISGDKLLDEHLNALSIDSIAMESHISIMKKHKIEKAELLHVGKLTEDATRVFKSIFDQYSKDGLMSKAECKRLQKRMVGDSLMFVENKVNKMFQNHDADKDDHLKLSEFLQHYEVMARLKPNSVWNSLEAMGIREDLRTLGDIPLTQPDPTTLPRYMLIRNKKFMSLLFELLKQEGSIPEYAWSMLIRLPLYQEKKQFTKDNKYELRYWLYLLDANVLSDKLTNDDLRIVLLNDEETLAIGLKVADNQCLQISAENFSILLKRIEAINESKLSKYSKVVLKFSLSIISRAVETQPVLKEEFLRNNARFEKLFLSGLMSGKSELRNIYIEAVNDMFKHFNGQPDLFSMLFNIVYTNFEKCNKKDLSPEYFHLFTNALEEARSHNLLQQIGGNTILETVVKVFMEHQSSEQSLSSPEDYVAIGFMKLIGTLLTPEYQPTGFVVFLFSECLFPQSSDKSHELKSARSRKEAYDLVYRLCSFERRELDELFKANFKKIYKTVSQVKMSNYFKEVRSEYGYAGIHNLGCICYMISMLQQFFLTKPFRYLMLMADDGIADKYRKYGNRQIDDNTLHQLQTMFANLELTEKQDYNPQDFCFSFKDFDGQPVNVGVQQDAQEFLNMLFDKIEQSLKQTPFRHVADSIYGGKYCNQFICSNCKHIIERHENFYSLSLEVKGQNNIQDSFKKFITGEVISDYKCDNCNKKTDTAKRCFISGLPNYLILYLQRICFNYDKFENEKINTRWEFPHLLNLFDYTLDKEKGLQTSFDYEYVLKGIVVHIGSAEFGHYFSYIKTPEGSWLEYNDQRVREFNPKDIENEAFGGGVGWRKDNQSAYLLLYEKVDKKPFPLEFITEEQKQQILNRFGLKQIVQQPPQPSADSSLTVSAINQKLEKKEEQSQPAPTSAEPKPIIAHINLLDVQPYVAERARTKIDKANEEFTLQMQVTSNEFVEFLYKISMIDPPAHLKNEFLQMCYQCFPIKQMIGDSHMCISDEMPKRFNELIKGSGWYFFETQSANWHKELFSIEKTIRISTKRLIISVLSDIFETYPPQPQQSQVEAQYKSNQLASSAPSESIETVHTKEQTKLDNNNSKLEKVYEYLNSLIGLMKEEVQDGRLRMQEYFETWIELARSAPQIRQFLNDQKMTELLLDYLLEESSPLKIIANQRRVATTRFFNLNEQVFELLFDLIPNDRFSENQLKCFVSYAFLDKLVKVVNKKPGFVSNICRSNSLISERVAYTISDCLMKVTHSDDSKPIIESIIEFISIKDDLTKLRKEWVIGMAQLEYHTKTHAYGMYNLPTVLDVVYEYCSPLGIAPVLKIIHHMREKYDHVTILLIIMLLQLEREGHISLSQYPGNLPLQCDYTSWFETQIDNYYEQMMNPKGGQKIPDNYKGYATKVHNLWHSRPEQSRPARYLIGKTLAQNEIRSTDYPKHNVKIVEYELNSMIAQAEFEDNGELKHAKKIIYKGNSNYFVFDPEYVDSCPNGDMFLRKGSRCPEGPQKIEGESPFDKAFKCDFVRKITIKNTGNEAMILLKFVPCEGVNSWLPHSSVRFVMRPMSDISMIITKENADEPWGEYEIELDTVVQNGKLRLKEYPQQLITPYNGDEEVPSDNDDDDSFTGYYGE